MKKWFDEEYSFEIEVTGFLRGDRTEHYCRNGEEIGDRYTCTYGCPVNRDGQGICSKTMMMLYIRLWNRFGAAAILKTLAATVNTVKRSSVRTDASYFVKLARKTFFEMVC